MRRGLQFGASSRVDLWAIHLGGRRGIVPLWEERP